MELVIRPTLEGVREAWDGLAAARELPSPFLRSWWLEAMASSDACFLLVTEDGKLLGGLPLERDSVLGTPRFRFIGAHSLAADHLDVVAAVSREQDVLRVLHQWFHAPGSRIVDLEGVAGTSVVAAALPRPVRCELQAVAPWASLPTTFAEYWAARPSLLRDSVRRAERRLDRLGVTFEALGPTDATETLAELARLHTIRWGNESAFTPSFQRFAVAARVGIERREFVAHCLRAGSRVIAIELWFEIDGVASFYQGGRETDEQWSGSGNVLKARVVERACERGFREIDLLRGDEPYKPQWADRSRRVWRLRAAHGVRAEAMLLALPAARRLRQVVPG